MTWGWKPLIYIILPVYNWWDFFKQQLYTIINQEYKNRFLIIINDGSTDNTQNIISDFISNFEISDRVTVISQKNTWQYAACGVWLEYIKKQLEWNYENRYVSYCDADDLRASNKLQIQLEYMQAHPECDLSYHDCWLIDDKNEIIWESAIMYFSSIFSSINMKKFIDVWVGHNVISTEMMFKAKFIDEILPVPDFMSQDRWVSICIIATNGSVNKIDRHLWYYRLHKSSSLHKKLKKIDFEKRQYDVFYFLKTIKSYWWKRDKIKDLDYILKYWEIKLLFRYEKKNILIKLIIMLFKFPRIMFLYIKNYIQILKFRLQLYKDWYKKRIKLHNNWQ